MQEASPVKRNRLPGGSRLLANLPPRRAARGRRGGQAPILPVLDLVSIAKGYGCDAVHVSDLDAIKRAVTRAWIKDVPTVLEIPISPQVPPLLCSDTARIRPS